MILVHGFSSNKNRTTYLDMEKHMLEIWVATFRIDCFGHGESDWTLEDITLSKGIQNVHDALDLMAGKWFKRVWLFGSSFWGCVVMNVASETKHDIYCVVCKCPVSDYAKQQERKLWVEWMREWKRQWVKPYTRSDWLNTPIKYWYYEDMKWNNVHEKTHKITQPLFIIHGTSDVDVQVWQSKKTAELAPNCTLVLVDWADHGFSNPWERLIINWYFKKFVNKPY